MIARSLLVAAMIASPVVAGTIVGQARDARQPLEDAVIYAILVGKAPPLANRTAVMDQKDRMFVPHVLPVQTGTAVHFPNSDDVRHHVYSFSRAKPFQLPLYKGTPANPIVFDSPGVVALACNIHDRMSAFIVVVDTPYFAKTDGAGRAELRDLPAGTYAVHVWHPDLREEPAPVSINLGAGESQEVPFVLGITSHKPEHVHP